MTTQIEMEFDELVQLYVKRDSNMKLDTKNTIQKFIDKLGYNKLNINDFLLDEYKKTDIREKSYYEWLSDFTLTDKYNDYKKNINNYQNRYLYLTSLLNIDNIEDFYKVCTLEELLYVGY